jgi:DNA-binding MarR family transcriptional regulator
MNRIELINQYLIEKKKSTYKYYHYLSTPHEYYPGDMLYMREVHVLLSITPEGAPTISDLMQILDITSGAVSQLVTRLEKKGYLRRDLDSNDKRRTIVCLTDKGKELYYKHLEDDQIVLQEVSTKLQHIDDNRLIELIESEKDFRKLFENDYNI